jgi:hypothetical protein
MRKPTCCCCCCVVVVVRENRLVHDNVDTRVIGVVHAKVVLLVIKQTTMMADDAILLIITTFDGTSMETRVMQLDGMFSAIYIYISFSLLKSKLPTIKSTHWIAKTSLSFTLLSARCLLFQAASS